MRAATEELILSARQILDQHNPMTLRQVYYQLVAAQIIPNNQRQYDRLSRALVIGRKEGLIPWHYIEDRTRQPRVVNMWNDLSDFLETVQRAYRQDIWQEQTTYLEIWVEKDALSGIFERITNEYGVTLIVGRGYNSWTALHDAANRIEDQMEYGNRGTKICYFGDFDPSGEDIVRAIREGLNYFAGGAKVEKVSLTREDITTYNLPPDFTKASDTRQASFVAKYGDIAVELDALPLPILQEKIRDAIETNLDMDGLMRIRQAEEIGREKLKDLATKI